MQPTLRQSRRWKERQSWLDRCCGVRVLPRELRRLPTASYLGERLYFLTLVTFERQPLFADRALVEICASQILRAGTRTRFEITAWAYMLDHLHVVVRGLTGRSNLRAFARLAKQLTAYYAKRLIGGALGTRGYHDRIVRHDEDPRKYLRYVRDNPKRAGLAAERSQYPYVWINSTSWRDL